MQKEKTPRYLYKILTLKDWQTSLSQNTVLLTEMDREFIHLSKEDQLDSILKKYWAHVPEYAILKVQTDQLIGDLTYETNPGGINKYYHLYEGSIPLKAVVEARIIKL